MKKWKITFDLFKTLAFILFVIAMFKLWGSNEAWLLAVLYLNTYTCSWTWEK